MPRLPCQYGSRKDHRIMAVSSLVNPNREPQETERNGHASKPKNAYHSDLFPGWHLQFPGQRDWKRENCSVGHEADGRVCDDNAGLSQAGRTVSFG